MLYFTQSREDNADENKIGDKANTFYYATNFFLNKNGISANAVKPMYWGPVSKPFMFPKFKHPQLPLILQLSLLQMVWKVHF